MAPNASHKVALPAWNRGNTLGNIEIVVARKRLGEKMIEELFCNDTNTTGTRCPKVPPPIKREGFALDIEMALAGLGVAFDQQDECPTLSRLS